MTSLQPGDFAPDFACASSINPEFSFNTAGGHRIVLCFIDGLGGSDGAALLPAFTRLVQRFRARSAHVLLVSANPADANKEVVRRLNAMSLVAFWDSDRNVARRFGVEGWRGSLVFDANMRFVAAVPLDDASGHLDAALAVIESMPAAPVPRTIQGQAPVLIVPGVFDGDLCRRLIDYFEITGGRPSGFMDEKAGRTFTVRDHRVKSRIDSTVKDETLRGEIVRHLLERIRPEVRKAFASDFTRIERYIVARYDAETNGHFSAHRDNTTTGTAHRKFAVTINLNAEAYEGGDLRFPEYGRDTYRAPTGGAVVFACGLMHEALPVTAGRRYAFLPFLYDEAGRRIRDAARGKVDYA